MLEERSETRARDSKSAPLLQYNTEATDAIAKFIAEHVAASTKTAAAKDLRSYFDAIPRQPVDNGDLYSP